MNTKGQNITINKTLEHTINIDRKANYRIAYWKLKENKFLRFEESKLQLFNQDFNKEWEIEMPYFNFQLCSDENNIFIFQSTSSNHLIKIGYDGSKKIINISDNVMKDHIASEIYSMQFIKNELFIFLRGLSRENEEKISQESFIILKFDSNGDFIDHANITSKNNIIKNVDWKFSEINNDNIILKRRYYKNEKGNIKTVKSKNYIKYEDIIHINSELETISENGLKIENPKTLKARHVPIKFDTTTTSIELDGVELKKERDFSSRTEFDRIKITLGDKYTTNITNDIIDLCGKKLYSKTKSKFKIIDVVKDPLNNNICIFSNIRFNSVMEGQICLIILNKDLKVVKIDVFLTSYFDYITRDLSKYNENFSFEYKTYKKTYGMTDSKHTMNAYEYVAEKGETEVMYSIINYSNYQLLLIDNKLTKKTKVLKFEK